MLEAMLEGWRGKRVLIVGDRGGLCAFLIAVLDEIGARPVCVSDRADAQTLCRALTAGRVSAAILPGEMTGRSLPERLEATLTLTREVREAGVPLLLAMSDAAVYRGGGRMNEAGEIGGRTREGMEASILQTAVLGAAYAVYRVAFYQKPTTKVPSPADMPTRECYRKAMGPDADALARDMFKAVHITAQDGTPLAARYYHHADGAPLAIIFHGYRGYAERDGLGGYTLCTALGYNVLLPDQRAHGYSGGHTITMGVKERYDARDWAVWARSHFGPEVPIFLMGVSMGAATVVLAAGLSLPDNVCGVVADCGYTSPREITRKCLPEYLPGMPLELTYAVGRLGAILFGHFDPEDADCEAAAAQSKVPILFVHGDADVFVPYDMGKRNYEACRAKGKKFLTVHGAEHAVSYYHDNDAYTKQATEFLQDCLARRGFVWPPETDEPEK